MEPERRQLTVMFCDLVGSTALSHALDPEDLRDVVRSYQECTGKVIARYDGFIARYMGDGILAYFGFPHAHEDDAARAIHAGIEIVEALGQVSAIPDGKRADALSVRIGIATGLVVVGDIIGEGASEQAVAMGETPNLAARIQDVAKPGTVVIAQRTRELAAGAFEYADGGTHELKGFPQPVQVWSVLRTSAARTRFDASRSVRVTPFVGREREVNVLLARWEQARSGAGQLIMLSGEAGIGKSRIGEHVHERIAGDTHIRLRYQCSPYHENSALHPFIQHLERAAQFQRSDSPEQKLDKLEAALAKPAPPDRETTALFAGLLSLPLNGRYPALRMSAQQQKEKTLAALLERLRVVASKAPALVSFEDAHWIDPTSLEYLGLAARHIAGLPVLAIITSRSALDYPWLHLPHVTSLHLQRLERDQSAAMVARLLEGQAFPAELVGAIVARTDGVPLFIEELAKTIRSSDACGASPQPASAAIPATIQDSLMARLDRLGPAKEVAQMGAVIGREFSRNLLAAISPLSDDALGAALSTLTRSTVVDADETGATFVFKHALLQDAAYASLLRSSRQALHARIAQTLEHSYPERVRAGPELVAYHYTQAGSALAAAKYWAAAAQRALDRWANPEAVGHATRGLDVLATLPAGGERAQLELVLEILRGTAYRAVKGFASPDAERSFTRTLELSAALGNVPRLIDARRGLFGCYYARGALALAGEQGREVAALAEHMDDPAPRALGQWMLGCVTFWQGEFATASAALEKAYSLHRPHAQPENTLALQIDPGVNALLHLSWVRWILGYPDQAIATSESAIDTARKLAQPFALVMALFWACATRVCCGHHAASRRLLDELQALSARHGLEYFASCARVLEGQYLISQDRCAAGFEQIGRALAEFRSQEAGLGIPWALSISATGYLRLGKAQEGLAAVSEALEAAGRNGEHHWDCELWRLQGELVLLSSAPDEAEADSCFASAIELARQQCAKSLELRAATSRARLYARRGDAELARQTLAPVLGWFEEGFDTEDIRNATDVLQKIIARP
jgi:class 3 adenylate cyclase/predicted ATPase